MDYSTKRKLKFIDLFCGIGGFHQALTNMGGECVFACDIDEKCRVIYEENYGIKPASDITKINIDDIPPFDVLCAGFPCQPFSKAGFQKGFDDDRGNLFFNICDIIKRQQQREPPKYLLLENVRNLASHDDGNTWKVIYEYIDKLGYYTYELPVILNAMHFNIPQNRERVIIMCKRKDIGELRTLPIIPKNPKHKLTKHIKDFLCDKKDTEKYIIGGKMKDVEIIWDAFIKLLIAYGIDIPKFPIWTDWWDNIYTEDDKMYIKYKAWIDKNRKFYNSNKAVLEEWLMNSRANKNWFGSVRKFEWQAGDLLADDSMRNVLWSARGSGIRVKRCDYIPTLVAMAMIPVYGPESRKLTPRELLRLQSFPDTFQFNEKNIYKQVGNSVNVKMIERCARFLIDDEELL
jgi:DNA (cytosine-5)-methyltransferase 1